jgi:hypothetical protein
MLVHRCLGSLLLLVEKVKVPRHGLIQAICYSVCRLIVQQFFCLADIGWRVSHVPYPEIAINKLDYFQAWNSFLHRQFTRKSKADLG